MKRIKLLLFFTVLLLTMVLTGCKPVNLTTSVTPNGSGTISPNGGTYKNGQEITLVATPAKYYKFNSWAGEVSGNTNPLIIKMNSNKNIVASFTKIMYNLQLNSNISNSGTLDPKSGAYEAGSQITINATTASGYIFENWGGSASGKTNPQTITLDSDKTITAYFSKLNTLQIVRNPNEGGTISIGNGVYKAGTVVNISATQEFPYAFVSWAGTDANSVNPTKVTMDTDKTVTCNFKKLTPGDWRQDKNAISRYGTRSFFVELNQYEWFEGNIDWNYIAYIQDPAGTTIKNFGSTAKGVNFQIPAKVPGKYSIVMQNTDELALQTGYTINYRIWK